LAQAWDEFYRVYSNLIRRFVQAQGLRGADADDCVQEVWSTVALKLAEFERPQQRPGLRSWLYTVVRSKTTDYLRRSRCRPARSLDQAVDQGHEPVGREPDPAVVWEHQWQQALIRTAMDELRQQLPDESFRVLQMRLLEGRSEAETAAALNLTVEQVHSRKYRAQQKLQSLVAVYTGQDSE
jgi:RNA polymerase sigma-70 factor (ECF subfamily)